MVGKIIQLIVVVAILVVLLLPRSLPSIGAWLGRALGSPPRPRPPSDRGSSARDATEVVDGAQRPRRGNFPWPKS